MRTAMIGLAALALAGCAGGAGPGAGSAATAPVEVGIIAFNDFHGNLEPPRFAIDVPNADGSSQRVPAGGAAYFASAVAELRKGHANALVLSAGDMISASPAISSLFLDEPTIHAMNQIGVDFDAVGNHEFDRGQHELKRIQNGGCEKLADKQPCALERYTGARFQILAANVATADGGTLFPAYGIRSFGTGARQVKVGVIGMTLKGTPELVMQAGIAGLTFRDEADTVNALIPRLKAQGADAVVVLIHQGGYTKGGWSQDKCEGPTGDIWPILARLDPAVDLVVSGHTHEGYICDYARTDPGRPFLLTSAGKWGTMLTDITLAIDPVAHRVVAKRARNVIVQGEAYAAGATDVPLVDAFPRFAADPAIAALVARYGKAASEVTARVAGQLTAPATKTKSAAGEHAIGDLLADAQLEAARQAGLQADLAFMNQDGPRNDLVPAANGDVTMGQLFVLQPFGNVIVTRSYTGAQLRAVLEQQFQDSADPHILLPSAGLRYAYDTSRPAGQRVRDVTIDGRALDDARVYRVALSNYLAGGGDSFSTLAQGTDERVGPKDVDAFAAYLARHTPVTPPVTDRVRNVTPKN